MSFVDAWVHPRLLVGVYVAHLFSSLCFVLCLTCLHPVSCVPNVVIFSGLSILDCPLVFSNDYFPNKNRNMVHYKNKFALAMFLTIKAFLKDLAIVYCKHTLAVSLLAKLQLYCIDTVGHHTRWDKH